MKHHKEKNILYMSEHIGNLKISIDELFPGKEWRWRRRGGACGYGEGRRG